MQQGELWTWPSSGPAPHFKLLRHLCPAFLMICLQSALHLAKLGLMITQKSPLWLAYSDCRAPSVWIERRSWVGWGSALFSVQISSWWSVIWTVCLAFILRSTGPVCWAAVQTLLCPTVEHLQLWSLIDRKFFTAGYRGEHREEGARGRGILQALGFRPSWYTGEGGETDVAINIKVNKLLLPIEWST